MIFMKYITACIASVLITLFGGGNANAEIYRCKLPSGKVEMRDFPCDLAARPVISKLPSPPPKENSSGATRGNSSKIPDVAPRQGDYVGVCDLVRGAVVVAQNGRGTFLGKIASEFDADSIFCEYGIYGSPYGVDSVWYPNGQYGSEDGAYSSSNPHTLTPPMIVQGKLIVGYLTANKSIANSIPLTLLKKLCKTKM